MKQLISLLQCVVPSLVPVSILHGKWKWGYIRWLGHSHVHCYAWQKQQGLVVVGVCVLGKAKQRSLSEQALKPCEGATDGTWPKAVLNLNCHTLLWHSLRHAISVRQHSKHIQSVTHFKAFHQQKKNNYEIILPQKVDVGHLHSALSPILSHSFHKTTLEHTVDSFTGFGDVIHCEL